MTLDELRKWRDAKPFVPFVIEMASGNEFPVATAGSIALPPVESDAVFVAGVGGGPIRLGLSSIVAVRRRPTRRRRKAG